MLDKEKAVQGVAVYGEFSRRGATTQMIITPDGYTSNGTMVPATVIRRTITTHTPKKAWKFSRLATAEVISGLEPVKEDYAAHRLRYASSLFDQLLSGGWTIVRKPVLVEMSRKDADDINQMKTPTKMIYRISQSRTALDFPEDLIQTD
jgi:hypothetical protein